MTSVGTTEPGAERASQLISVSLTEVGATRKCQRTGPQFRRRQAQPTRTAVSTPPKCAGVDSLHTLGPAGTNCELAAQEWFEHLRRAGTVVLHDTLEQAAEAAARTPGAALMAPVAYPRLHSLIYAHLDVLELADSHITMTHNMVLARRPGAECVRSVAAHPAPEQLVPAGCEVRLVASNAQAAVDCAAGLTDGCITTLPAMESNDLDLVRDFGPVAMAFTVHVRRDESR